jgi:hypothetical protein
LIGGNCFLSDKHSEFWSYRWRIYPLAFQILFSKHKKCIFSGMFYRQMAIFIGNYPTCCWFSGLNSLFWRIEYRFLASVCLTFIHSTLLFSTFLMNNLERFFKIVYGRFAEIVLARTKMLAHSKDKCKFSDKSMSKSNYL